jgi:hypothetical protein
MTDDGLFELRDMVGSHDGPFTMGSKGWVRAVPVPFWWGLPSRIRQAWAVITGRAHPVRWPKPGELEAALGEDTP